jgi:hypothetical protein
MLLCEVDNVDIDSVLNENFNLALSKVKCEEKALVPSALYHGLVNIDEFETYLRPASIFIQSLLDDLDCPPDLNFEDESIDKQLNCIVQYAEQDLKASPLNVDHDSSLECYLYQYAPIGLIPGGWLKNATRLVYAENHSGLMIQEIAKKWFAFSDFELFDGSSIRKAFHKLTNATIECGDPSFVSNTNITPYAFEYSLPALCLGLFPAKYMPEIAGFNLWQSVIGIKTLTGDLGVSETDQHTALRNKLIEEAKALIRQLLCENWCEDAICKQRIVSGFLLAHSTHMRWRASLVADIGSLSPENRMINLIESKAKYAIGYHDNINIKGKSLDHYLEEGEPGYLALLDALKASPYINIKKPHLSPLINQSISFKGKMFGVFTHEEIKVIKDWIADQSDDEDTNYSLPQSPDLAGHYTPPFQAKDFHLFSENVFASKGIEELTYYIANYDKFPIVTPILNRCAKFIVDALERSSEATCPEGYIPQYSMDNLEVMLENNRLFQVMKYKTNMEPLLTGEALINKYVTAFPGYCTDGCWLDGTFQPGKMHLEEYRILYDIYRDENGAGDFNAYHNFIARELFESMGYQFPSLDKPEFYLQENISASFVTPFVQYSLSAKTSSLLPEILGINLMLETNDISSVNRRNSEELKASGYDPLYMDLHVVIDNYASGHGYLAKRAIISLIEGAGRLGSDYQQALWKRVFKAYTGMNNFYNGASNPMIRAILMEISEFTIDTAITEKGNQVPNVA